MAPFAVKTRHSATGRRLDRDRHSFVVDVENLRPAAGENEEFAFLEFGNKCDVTDVMALVIDTVFFMNDERNVEIVASCKLLAK